MMGHSAQRQYEHEHKNFRSFLICDLRALQFADLTEVRLYDADDDNELPISHRK